MEVCHRASIAEAMANLSYQKLTNSWVVVIVLCRYNDLQSDNIRHLLTEITADNSKHLPVLSFVIFWI